MVTAKISIVCEDPQLTQRLIQSIHFLNMTPGEVIDRPREAYMHLDPMEPRIVLLVEPSEASQVTQIIEQLKKVNETAPIVYMSLTDEFVFLREIFRAGIMDVLRVSDEFDQLGAILGKAVQQLRHNRYKQELQASAPSANSGAVIAVYSGKGGAGTTVISANLAQAIALNTGARTLLIDLNLQFGGIHHLFDIRFERNLGDLKSVLRELTFSQLGNVLYKMESSGLSILLSPNHPKEAENFGSGDIELLLTACRQHFDFIVLDLPKELNEISISAIGQCDQLLYVLNLERPAILRMLSVMDILNRYHLIKEEHIALVINKFSRTHDVTRSDLEKMTTLPVIGTIAEDRKGVLQSNVNLGRPLLTTPHDKGGKGPPGDLFQLMSDLLARIGGEKDVHLPKAQQPAGRSARKTRNFLRFH